MIATWRQRVHTRLSEEGLVGVLMKPRNGLGWTPDESAQLRRRLVGLARWVPVFVVLLLPGSIVLLPVLAWVLDRRRARRADSAPRVT